MDFKTLSTVDPIDLKIPGLKIISRIGEGGMSVVYLAEQVSLKREIAVKVMKFDVANNDIEVQRFKHEAKTIAHLDHPNIINIYNIGQTSTGEIFFTMPYLNHGDFSNYILEDENEFIQLLQSICDGLAYAHDRGTVHRDIKPENLLFDKFGNVRIADFGIAISKDGTRMTKEHQIVGSAQYMSPEQARSLKVDVHTDIYSLGIVIYERLTGRVPFDADESISILVSHVSAEPPKLSSKMRHWQHLIDKCLAKSPRDRYQSMTELKIALNKVPVNSFQRTNSSIQSVFSNDFGKHLKWFIPSLVLLVIVTILGFNNVTKEITPQVVESNIPETKIISTPEISDVPEKIIVENSSENTGINDSVEMSKNQPFNSADTDEMINDNLSIDEIKQQLQSNQSTTDSDTVELVETNDTVDAETRELLIEAAKNIEEYQLTKPSDNNATDQLLEVLSLYPDNQEAVDGIELIGKAYYNLIDGAIRKADFNTALKHARSLIGFNQKTNDLNPNIQIHKEAILKIIQGTETSDESISAEQVLNLSRVVKLFSPEDTMLANLKQQAALKRKPKVGDSLLDEMGIESILVSNQLSVSINEVTVENYSEFAKATTRRASKCRNKSGIMNNLFSSKTWKNANFSQTEDHPVICVSYDDAVAYSDWVSKQTGNSYRLPTRPEWLALTAVENNSFEACQSGNLTGTESISVRNKEDKYKCYDKYKNTAPVASFNINNQGLYDIQGNVAEWVGCSKPPCSAPVAMGSSWFSGKQSNVSDKSEKLKPSTGYSWVGFRLVRDL